MDSGVHVWSTPLGYCDGETEGCIKDEEEVPDEPVGDLLGPSGSSVQDPLNLSNDPLCIGTTDATSTCTDPLAAPDLAEEAGPPDTDLAADGGAQLTTGLSSVSSVPSEPPAESADTQDTMWFKAEPEDGKPPAESVDSQDTMWFKAEPEDDSALTSETSVAEPPAWASGVGEAGGDYEYPPSPDPMLPLDLVDPESGRELFTCKVCRSSFKQKQQRDSHYKTVHPGYRPYKCDICGNRYNKEAFVRSHRKLHTGEKDYVCDACGRGFVSQARLTAHLKTARYCPASKNVDKEALMKRKREEEESTQMWLEWEQIKREQKRAKTQKMAKAILIQVDREPDDIVVID